MKFLFAVVVLVACLVAQAMACFPNIDNRGCETFCLKYPDSTECKQACINWPDMDTCPKKKKPE